MSDILKAVREALATPRDDIAKSFTQSGSATTGLTAYSLEAPAKTLYPVLTPLRNKIARVTGGTGIQANWRAITGINTTQMTIGVGEGKRGGVLSESTTEYLAAFRFLGLENNVTFEAEGAAQGFDDVKARAVESLLRSTMIQEEFLDLGGNNSIALGTCGTPTLADVTTGGTLSANTAYKVRCVALTLAAYQQAAGVANGTVNDAAAIASLTLTRTTTRTNADGTTDTINNGFSQVSSEASVTTANDSNATHCVSASVTPVRGAVAYAWFWGTSGSVFLGAVTTINSVLITATATGAQNVTDFTGSAADNSQNSLVYDGILTQVMKSGSGGYFVDLATGTPGTGTVLASDGAAGITQINTALASFWDNYRLSPSVMWVNRQQHQDISTKVIANNAAPLLRLTTDANGAQEVSASRRVTTYINPIDGTEIAIKVHPNIPPGMILFWSDMIPYPLSGVGTLVRKLLRRDYYQIEWPLRTRKYEYGVYFDGVLQNYFPPAFGVLRNIAPG